MTMTTTMTDQIRSIDTYAAHPLLADALACANLHATLSIHDGHAWNPIVVDDFGLEVLLLVVTFHSSFAWGV